VPQIGRASLVAVKNKLSALNSQNLDYIPHKTPALDFSNDFAESQFSQMSKMSNRSTGISAPVSQHRKRMLGRSGLRNSMDDVQSSKVVFNMNKITVNRLIPSRNSLRSSLDE